MTYETIKDEGMTYIDTKKQIMTYIKTKILDCNIEIYNIFMKHFLHSLSSVKIGINYEKKLKNMKTNKLKNSLLTFFLKKKQMNQFVLKMHQI